MCSPEVELFGQTFQFCKTSAKQYDIVVVALLCLVSATLGEFAVSSDGNDSDWAEGLALAKSALGRHIPMPAGIRATNPQHKDN